MDYPIRQNVLILGYYTNHAGPSPKGTMEGIEHDGGRVVPGETITDPQQLKGLISQVLDASHELFPNRIHPPRRIVAAPVSKVDG